MVGWDLTMAAFFWASFFAGHFFFRGEHILVWEGRKLLEASGSLGGNYLSLPPDTTHSANLHGGWNFVFFFEFSLPKLGEDDFHFDIVLLKNVTQHAPKRKGIFPKSSFIHLQHSSKIFGSLKARAWFLATFGKDVGISKVPTAPHRTPCPNSIIHRLHMVPRFFPHDDMMRTLSFGHHIFKTHQKRFFRCHDYVTLDDLGSS